MIFCSNFQFKLMFFVATKHRRCTFLQGKRLFLLWVMGVSPSLSIGNNFGSMRWKLRLGIVLIWSNLQMFLHLAVDSSQSPEGTLNLNFLFASFKRVEKDSYLCQMPTLVHRINQKNKFLSVCVYGCMEQV